MRGGTCPIHGKVQHVGRGSEQPDAVMDVLDDCSGAVGSDWMTSTGHFQSKIFCGSMISKFRREEQEALWKLQMAFTVPT